MKSNAAVDWLNVWGVVLIQQPYHFLLIFFITSSCRYIIIALTKQVVLWIVYKIRLSKYLDLLRVNVVAWLLLAAKANLFFLYAVTSVIYFEMDWIERIFCGLYSLCLYLYIFFFLPTVNGSSKKINLQLKLNFPYPQIEVKHNAYLMCSAQSVL